jgi:hypothetical protein
MLQVLPVTSHGDAPLKTGESAGGAEGRRSHGFKPPAKNKSKNLAIDQHLYLSLERLSLSRAAGDAGAGGTGADAGGPEDGGDAGGGFGGLPPGIWKMPDDVYGCRYCLVKGLKFEALQDHINSRKHKTCMLIVQM